MDFMYCLGSFYKHSNASASAPSAPVGTLLAGSSFRDGYKLRIPTTAAPRQRRFGTENFTTALKTNEEDVL
jgi:hypothetical protein